jgi:hypothetical protein
MRGRLLGVSAGKGGSSVWGAQQRHACICWQDTVLLNDCLDRHQVKMCMLKLLPSQRWGSARAAQVSPSALN